jgi:prefoldin subunit 5
MSTRAIGTLIFLGIFILFAVFATYPAWQNVEEASRELEEAERELEESRTEVAESMRDLEQTMERIQRNN